MALVEPPGAHATSWRADEEGARYELGRPGYPDSAVEVLTEKLELRPGSTVVDVAAGTGKLTRLLASTPAHVIAVEPMPGMRAELTRRVPGVAVVAARAEQLPLAAGTADALTVAQAFHWFDVPSASRELRRVLRPGGRLAIVYNRRHSDEAWVRRLWDVVSRYERLAPRPVSMQGWRAALDAAGDFGPFDRCELIHAQHFGGLDDLEARFASISFVILLDEAVRRAMMADLRAAVAGVEPLVVPLRTEIEVAARRE